MRGMVFRAAAATAAVSMLVGCGGGAAPSPTFSVVGTWSCQRTTNPSPDTVEVKADGTITVTQPDGATGSGTWTVAGSTFTVHGIGRGGQEDFVIDGQQMASVSADNICTRT